MADPLDNETLSQEALDALVDSVDTDSTDAVAGDLISDTGIDPGDQGAAEPIGGDSVDPAAQYANQPAASSLHMASFAAAASAADSFNNFDRVTDIPLDLTVELGRTRLLIKDILELGSGSIVELEKTAGEPVDLLANGLLIARGEVVVIDDNFGVRITEIITGADRTALAENPVNASAA